MSDLPNRKGLGTSKKFAVGTVHENGTGTFTILERFAGEEEQPTLKIEWLSGEKQGQIETNKETNINASIHKFKVHQRASGSRNTPYQPIPIGSAIEDIHDLILDNRYMIENCMASVQNAENHSRDNRDTIAKFFARLGEMEDIMSQQQRTITTLTNQIQKMIDGGVAMNKLTEVLNKQQEVMQSLVSKLP